MTLKTIDTQTLHPWQALSPLDGRYATKTLELREFFSETGLMRYRVTTEIAWLKMLGQLELPELPLFSPAFIAFLDGIDKDFDHDAMSRIKSFEATTNHDVKAVEYYLKAKLSDCPTHIAHEAKAAEEFIHFACTSEDINNVAYALMLRDACKQIIFPMLQHLTEQLRSRAHLYANTAMMSRTHGQPASPTTMGKEWANVVYRLEQKQLELMHIKLPAKMNGAVGNYNAHMAAYPMIDWPNQVHQLMTELGLTYNPYTIQIEPHDGIATLCNALAHINVILVDFCRDIWGYISLGYFTQKLAEGEVGSSTMPHKVNPIDFENAEGNLGLANALFKHFSEKLPISRWQRDLTDSTVLRNLGVALGYALLAYKNMLTGVQKLNISEAALADDLNDAWELLAEPIQTVMRRYGLKNPYEQLKALTRGKGIDQASLHHFIEQSDLPEHEKNRLKLLRPADYLGIASQLAAKI